MRTICILKIFLYHLILRTVYINYMNIIVVHAVCVSDMCMGKIVAIMGHIAHTHTQCQRIEICCVCVCICSIGTQVHILQQYEI